MPVPEPQNSDSSAIPSQNRNWTMDDGCCQKYWTAKMVAELVTSGSRISRYFICPCQVALIMYGLVSKSLLVKEVTLYSYILSILIFFVSVLFKSRIGRSLDELPSCHPLGNPHPTATSTGLSLTTATVSNHNPKKKQIPFVKPSVGSLEKLNTSGERPLSPTCHKHDEKTPAPRRQEH